jgi:hypothetical protein
LPTAYENQDVFSSRYFADRGSEGLTAEVVELLEHVVVVREKMVTEDHPSRLAPHHALAGIYPADGQVGRAVELLEHVVAVQEKVLTT